MKIGLNFFSVNKFCQDKKGFVKTLTTLQKNGLDFAQISGISLPNKEIDEICKEYKMPIVLTHTPYDRLLNDLENVIKEHKAFKCKNIGLGSMPHDVVNDEKKLKEVCKIFNSICLRLKKEGMKFFYHNHSHEFKRLKNGDTILKYLIKNVPDLNFTLDTYWVQYGGASILEVINDLKGRIECVHLKDYKINNDLQPEFAVLGEGNINFKDVVKAMKQAGTKYFLIEQDNASDKPDGIKDIIKSIKYIKEEF